MISYFRIGGQKKVCAKTTLTMKLKVKFFVYCSVFCSSGGAKVSTEPWCRKWSLLLEKLLVLIILKLALLTMCLRLAVRCKKNGSYWYRLHTPNLSLYIAYLPYFVLFFLLRFFLSLFFWLFKQSRTRTFCVGQISPQNYT